MGCHQSMRAQRPIIIAAAFALCLSAVSCGFRTGDVVLIPDGYVGWVRIYYQDSAARSLTKEGGRRLIRIKADGTTHTSSALESGYAIDAYFYVSPSGKRTKLKLEDLENRPEDMIHTFT